jgi:hypothetical protein
MGQAIQIGVVLEAKQLYSLYLMYLIEIIKWRITKQFLDCLHGFATPEWKQDETGWVSLKFTLLQNVITGGLLVSKYLPLQHVPEFTPLLLPYESQYLFIWGQDNLIFQSKLAFEKDALETNFLWCLIAAEERTICVSI